MGKWCLHASLFLGKKDMFKNYKMFDFWHVQTADIGGTKPWKNNCSLIWKLFKFLITLLAGLFEMRGCWHIGLRWAIVALWATCFRIWRSAKPRPMINVILQFLELDLININVSAKIYQNIPNSLRVKFHCFQNLNVGKISTNPKCGLTISWATSCQYQCVCKISSQYSTQFKR